MIHHHNMRKRSIAVALLVVLPVSLAAAAPTGKITVRSTETLKPQDVTNGGVSGTGRFTVSGAIRDEGAVTDYRTVKGGGATVLIRRVVVGKKGTITFRITIHVGTTSPEPWIITAAAGAYKGMHGKGTQVVDNYGATPATFVLKGTVSFAAGGAGAGAAVAAGTLAHAAGGQLTRPEVVPGLSVVVPAGWAAIEDNQVNFVVSAPGRPNEIVSIWLNVRAVKSTGRGHGTTVLTNVAASPSALVRWLTTNRDFRVLASPARVTISHFAMTGLTIGVSSTARYGDPHCPANPHCADVFTNPTYGTGDWYGIGGKEVVRLYLGHIAPGTVIVGLDANNPAALSHLEKVAKPLLNSIRFPQ